LPLRDFVLLTCEHGGNRVPAEYARLFQGQRDILATHRAYDPGALLLAKILSRRLKTPLHFSTVTRLLVELNRSLGHPALFSEFTKRLSAAQRDTILRKHYEPYRSQVEAEIGSAIDRRRRAVHLSMHSFTPILNNKVRRADVGVLYDPARPGEQSLADLVKKTLATSRPDLQIRKNYPYLGKSDGFTKALRKKWSALHYIGIEIEVNQQWYFGDRRAWKQLTHALADVFATSLAQFSRVSAPKTVR
jgi:predicted N-formylglutamate amidohydrolase